MAVYRLGSTFIPSIVHRFSQVIVGQHFAEDHLVAVNLLDQRCPGPPLLAGQALLKGPYLDLLGLRQRSQNNLGVSILCPKPVRLHVVAEREKAALQGPLRDDLVNRASDHTTRTTVKVSYESLPYSAMRLATQIRARLR